MTEVVPVEPAEATWQGTFEVEGQLTDVPAQVDSAGCTAIGLMTLDLHRDTIGTQGSVRGRLQLGVLVGHRRPGMGAGTAAGIGAGHAVLQRQLPAS